MRAAKKARDEGAATVLAVAFAHDRPRSSQQNGAIRLLSGEPKGKTGPGPFSPSDTVAQSDQNLTACRRCGWFNRFFHRNFRYYTRLHPTGFLDWCQACGRVASAKDFGKNQSEPYQPRATGGDVLLGTREIPFPIFAHDPRKMYQYADKWKSEQWEYNEAEMKYDVFATGLEGIP